MVPISSPCRPIFRVYESASSAWPGASVLAQERLPNWEVDWVVLAAGAVGLAAAVMWTIVEGRADDTGRRVFSAGLVGLPLLLGVAVPSLEPALILGVTVCNLLFAYFLAWGLSAAGDNPGTIPLHGIGCLGVALGWLAALTGSRMILQGTPPLGVPLLLLSILPVLASVVAAGDLRAGGERAQGGFWMLALLFLPPLLALRMYIAEH